MTNDDLHELTAAYALDALNADERREFEAHLPGCERCRTELSALSETVGALAFAAEGPVPPEELRGRILVTAREEPPNVVALRPRRTRLYTGAALAAAACAAIAIGLWVGLSGGGGSQTKLAWSVNVERGVAQLTVTGLTRAPSGKDYEIWVIDGGKPQPAGLFEGGARAVVRLTRAAPPGSTVAVTLERDGGTSAPTTPIVLSTQLPA